MNRRTGGVKRWRRGGSDPDYSVKIVGVGSVQYAGGVPILACGCRSIRNCLVGAASGPLLLTPQVCINGVHDSLLYQVSPYSIPFVVQSFRNPNGTGILCMVSILSGWLAAISWIIFINSLCDGVT